MPKPLISVIIAVLNNEKTIQACLESVINQDYANKEIIIIDGKSCDNTVSIIKQYAKYLFYWESKKDNGIYHAWNKALQWARGDWICFLGSDDYFYDNKVLSNLLIYLNRANSLKINVVYGKALKISHDDKIIKISGTKWEKIKWLMPHGMPLIHTGMMHHKILFRKHGLFNEKFKIAGDYEFLLRELLNNKALYAEDVQTVVYRSGGISDSLKITCQKEVAFARKIHNLPKFSWIFCLVYLRVYLRNILKNIIGF